MFEIIDGSDIHLKLTAFENDANSFQVGNEVTAYTNLENDEQYKAHIISISPSLNETSRSFDIHCHFVDKNAKLIPGMYMNAKVSGAKSQKLLFADDAVVSYGKKNFIFTDHNNNTYEMMEIEITYKGNGLVGISSETYGYLKSQKVVIKNAGD